MKKQLELFGFDFFGLFDLIITVLFKFFAFNSISDHFLVHANSVNKFVCGEFILRFDHRENAQQFWNPERISQLIISVGQTTFCDHRNIEIFNENLINKIGSVNDDVIH